MIKCIICGQEVDVIQADGSLECNKMVLFSADGNYGSSVFDPIGHGPQLLAIVHDRCLLDSKDRFFGRQVIEKTTRTVELLTTDEALENQE